MIKCLEDPFALKRAAEQKYQTVKYRVYRDQYKKEKRQALAAAREAALTNEQAMIESRLFLIHNDFVLE